MTLMLREMMMKTKNDDVVLKCVYVGRCNSNRCEYHNTLFQLQQAEKLFKITPKDGPFGSGGLIKHISDLKTRLGIVDNN